MNPTRTLAFLLLFLVAAAVAAGDEPGVRTYAVRTAPGADDLAAAVSSGSFEQWYASRDDSVELVAGPGASGDVEVELRRFPVTDEELPRRLKGLPVELDGQGIVFDGTLYPGPDYALVLRLPGAAKPTWTVVAYETDTAVALAEQVLWSASGRSRRDRFADLDYLVWETWWSSRSGRWRATADGWTVDPDEHDDIASRAATYAALAAVERPHVVLRVPPGRARDSAFATLADELESAVRAMAPRVPVKLKRPLEVLVERDYVDMGRHLAAIGEVVFDGQGRLHLVDHPDDVPFYRVGVARALLRRAGLAPPPRLEDGAALWLAGSWYGRPFADWLPDLAYGQVLPGADDLLADVPRDGRNEVLWPPAAAAVVERLPGETARDKLASSPSAARVAEVLRRIERESAKATRPAAKPVPPALVEFQHGVSLAMANGLETGYHAPGVDQQLARLAELGVDSVSLMPFASQPSPSEPRMGFLNGSPGSETDVGLIHAARCAHERAIRVLWKPQIWVGHRSWPGDIEMTSEEDWQAWWRVYRRFILRHAVLAEWSGSELFSVGVELGKTLGREAEWRSLIRAVRRVYSGRLTYSGNWWGDYDRAPFWDELDYVGVDAYFPLADSADAGREAVEEGARRAVSELRRAAERFGKPVVLTEVGFAARRDAWVSPHEEGGEYDPGRQAVAYEALLGALGRPPWLAGVYFWKVFSHPSIGGGEGPDFHILGRQAEQVVRSYFRVPTPATAATTAQ